MDKLENFKLERHFVLELLKQDGVSALIEQATHDVANQAQAASSFPDAQYKAIVSTTKNGLHIGFAGTGNWQSRIDNAKYNTLQKGLG